MDGDHPRLLIPFRDEKEEVFAYQGRSFGKEQPKYITIRLDDDTTKIFGFDRVDKSKQIKRTINQGRQIVIWPDSMKHKDINDMIVAGYTKEQIQEIIDDNTFSGVAAQLRFAEWKKIDEGSMGKAIRRKESTLEL